MSCHSPRHSHTPLTIGNEYALSRRAAESDLQPCNKHGRYLATASPARLVGWVLPALCLLALADSAVHSIPQAYDIIYVRVKI